MKKSGRKWMRLAIREAKKGIHKGSGGPFGVVVARKGKMIAKAHNTVLEKKDATCHAEINAIRAASLKLNKFDLSDCVIYSTTEPCPMCFSAIHWARIPEVIYGTDIRDVACRGFNELSISNSILKKLGKIRLRITKGFLRKECLRLLKAWDRLPGKKVY